MAQLEAKELSLPTPDQPHLVQMVALDGAQYALTFNWNARIDSWVLHISTADGTEVLSGIHLVPNWDLTKHIAAVTPPGVLWLYSSTGLTPTLETIASCRLFYLPVGVLW